MELSRYSKVFFVGIGGISMSALAWFTCSLGIKVQGSDATSSEIIDKLIVDGIDVKIGHSEQNISEDVDLLVYSGAIKCDNPERAKASKLGIKQMERSEYLGLISSMYGHVISVGGTHGKTTTTAMIGEVLCNAGLNPTIHLGGESVVWGNHRIGGKDIFLTEACEYRDSFLTLKSSIGVITNIDKDHMDYYKNVSSIYNSFYKFADSCDQVVVWDNKRIARALPNKTILVGFDRHFTYFVCNVKQDGKGHYSYTMYYHGTKLCDIALNVVGVHFVKDSACAFAVAHMLGVDTQVIVKSLGTYRGVKRRFELIGYVERIPIIADYAHHPREIKASIKSSKLVYGKVLCVFQPHTYSRTIALLDEFKNCFDVDKLIIFKTYSAREKYVKQGDARTLCDNIECKDKVYCASADNMWKEIENSKGYDVILVLGAGDIYNYFKNRYSK